MMVECSGYHQEKLSEMMCMGDANLNNKMIGMGSVHTFSE
jgi:hypothetical protein